MHDIDKARQHLDRLRKSIKPYLVDEPLYIDRKNELCFGGVFMSLEQLEMLHHDFTSVEWADLITNPLIKDLMKDGLSFGGIYNFSSDVAYMEGSGVGIEFSGRVIANETKTS